MSLENVLNQDIETVVDNLLANFDEVDTASVGPVPYYAGPDAGTDSIEKYDVEQSGLDKFLSNFTL